MTLPLLAACLLPSGVAAQATVELMPTRHVVREMQPGLTYERYDLARLFGDPQIVNVLRVEADSPAVRLQLTAADVWEQTRQPIPDLAAKVGALAAINGGFAPGRKHPEVGYGIMKFGGQVWPFVNDMAFHETVEGHGRNAVGIDARGGWHFRARGDRPDAADCRWDADWPEVVDAMAGGSRLVIDGQVNPLVTSTGRRRISQLRDGPTPHVQASPADAYRGDRERTAVLVTVNGRFPEHAVGMTLAEAAELMIGLGCTDAMELDGGGSTTMWLADGPGNGVMNYPTDNKTFDHEGLRPLRLAVLVMPRRPRGLGARRRGRRWRWPGPRDFRRRSPGFHGGSALPDCRSGVADRYPGGGDRLCHHPGGVGHHPAAADSGRGEGRGEEGGEPDETLSQTASAFLDEFDVEMAVNASTFTPVVQEPGLGRTSSD